MSKVRLCLVSAVLFLCLLRAGLVCAQVKDSVLDLSDSSQTSPIDYSNSTIVKINRNDAGNHFKNEVNFSGAKFKDDDFSFDKFDKNTDFSSSEFYTKADFSFTQFNSKSNFSSGTYNSTVQFDNAVFKKRLDFFSTRFKSDVNFKQTKFFDTVSFLEVEFHDTCNFYNAHFYKRVDFSHINLSGKINFQQATFGNYANFSQITFSDSGYLVFQKAQLPDTLDFSGNPRINNEIDLTAADFTDTVKGKSSKPHYIFLYRSDVSKFHFNYIHFKLLFRDPSTGLEMPVDEKEAMYEQALKNFQDRGQQVSYKLLDIEYQDFIWQRSGFKWIGWVPRLWWNYGYNKEYVFYWTVFLLVFFSMIVFFMLEFLNENVYEVENIPKHKINKFSVRDFGFRIWYSFVYTVSIMFRLTLDVTKIKYHKIGGTILILIMYLLGLVCIAYMANFVLQR
jgi:hypothetical protein